MLLGALVLVLASAPVPLPAAGHPDVKRGIEQERDGLLEEAVTTLDAAIVELAKAGGSGRGDLITAHAHRGAALVALQREDAAKEAFRQALALEPALRLPKGEFPDRVIRVFEAARTGKTKSVMERPAGAPKKAGLGAAAIAGIAGGALALGGAAVAVAAGSPSAPPTPAPSPTADPRTQVVPTTKTGAAEITFVAAVPPPGSVIAGCGDTSLDCTNRFMIGLRVRLDSSVDPRATVPLTVTLYDPINRICGHTQLLLDAPALATGQPYEVGVRLENPRTYYSCATPVKITRMQVRVDWTSGSGERTFSSQEWSIEYTLNP